VEDFIEEDFDVEIIGIFLETIVEMRGKIVLVLDEVVVGDLEEDWEDTETMDIKFILNDFFITEILEEFVKKEVYNAILVVWKINK